MGETKIPCKATLACTYVGTYIRICHKRRIQMVWYLVVSVRTVAKFSVQLLCDTDKHTELLKPCLFMLHWKMQDFFACLDMPDLNTSEITTVKTSLASWLLKSLSQSFDFIKLYRNKRWSYDDIISVDRQCIYWTKISWCCIGRKRFGKFSVCAFSGLG